MAIPTGYFLVALTYAKILPTPNFLVIALYFLTVGFGSASCYHSALSTNYRNWPKHLKSVAVGMSVSFFGLSAFVFSQAGRVFQEEGSLNVEKFLAFMAVCCAIVNLLAIFTLKQYGLSPVTSDGGEAALDERSPLLGHNSTSGLTEPAVRVISRQPSPAISPATADSTNVSSPRRKLVHFQSDLSAYDDSNEFIAQRAIQEDDEYIPAAPVIVLEEISCFTSVTAYLLAFNMFAGVGVGLSTRF
jgi:Nodulin-like